MKMAKFALLALVVSSSSVFAYDQYDSSTADRGYYYNQPSRDSGNYYYQSSGNRGYYYGYRGDSNYSNQQDSNYYYQDSNRGNDGSGYQENCPNGNRYYSNDQRGNGRSDSIEARVNDALHRDSTVNARNIQVSADQGNVTLNGSVRTDAEKSKAESIAKGIDGVKSVSNQLTVSK